jgi:Mrp family chromosome partitioning ATPase
LTANDRLGSANDRLASAQAALNQNNWSTLSQTLADDALAALASERSDLERQLGLVEAGSQQDIDLRAGLADLESRMTARAETAVNNLRSDITQQADATTGIRDQIRRTVLGGNLSSNTLTEIFSLQQEADIAQRQYQTLLSRQRDLETQALVQVADSRIVSEALPPRAASFPKRTRVLALALVASIAVGVGLAFLNEYYVGGINSAQQLGHLVPARVAAVIPRTDQRNDQLSVADNVVEAPMSIYAESIRRLRAVVDQTARPTDEKLGKIVVVVSSIPAEGKSSLAIALTRTYAVAGKRALMIDADLRKPALHKYLGLTPDQGFLDYLRDPSSVANADTFYERDPKSTAGAIMGHGRANLPTDQLLQSATFEAMISQARQELDVTIIDTPPLVPVVDARYILRHADVVVMSVRYGMTSQSDLRDAYAQVADSVRPGVPVLTVLTHDEARMHTYRYSGYYADYND